MSVSLNVQSQPVAAEVAEPEKRKPLSPAEFQDNIQFHPYYNQAVNAFDYFNKSAKRVAYFSRQPVYLQDMQSGVMGKIQNKIPDEQQQDNVKALFVSSFLVGSDASLEQDYNRSFQELKQAVCNHVLDQNHPSRAMNYIDENSYSARIQINAGQAVGHDINVLVKGARKEGEICAATVSLQRLVS